MAKKKKKPEPKKSPKKGKKTPKKQVKGKVAPKTKVKTKRKPNSYNKFSKALGAYLRENNVDWQRHGKFQKVASTVWKENKTLPLKEVIRNVDIIYEKTYPGKGRAYDIRNIRQKYALSDWYNFRDTILRDLLDSKYLKPKDDVRFRGDGVNIENYDLRTPDGGSDLHADLKALLQDRPSPPPAIVLDEIEDTDNELTIIYTIEGLEQIGLEIKPPEKKPEKPKPEPEIPTKEPREPTKDELDRRERRIALDEKEIQVKIDALERLKKLATTKATKDAVDKKIIELIEKL